MSSELSEPFHQLMTEIKRIQNERIFSWQVKITSQQQFNF